MLTRYRTMYWSACYFRLSKLLKAFESLCSKLSHCTISETLIALICKCLNLRLIECCFVKILSCTANNHFESLSQFIVALVLVSLISDSKNNDTWCRATQRKIENLICKSRVLLLCACFVLCYCNDVSCY